MKNTAMILSLAATALVNPQLSQAKPAGVTMAQARAIALRAAPGRIEKAEREREGGGLRYSFDIRQGNRIHEIGVDVATGRIVENKFEPLNARD
ncbi:PepSY domain-containing protein [Novosphingobium aquiterrae]|uniref:PepSY domain-containing protein n=1 Tax=Novosphingobium aquiterrae TaxID=624388 RepID=A0ABV6PHS2_9SPHN